MDRIHVVGLDGVTKQNVISIIRDHVILPPKFNIVDLDNIQFEVNNSDAMLDRKKRWRYHTMQFMKTKDKKHQNAKQKLESEIYAIWKDKMRERITKLTQRGICNIYLGLHVYSKNFSCSAGLRFNKKLFIEMNPSLFAGNQIKYYLTNHSKDIIDGKFCLRFLDPHYLIEKYEKIKKLYHHYPSISHTEKLNYDLFTGKNKLEVKKNPRISRDHLYVITSFRSKGLLPVTSAHPIKGYTNKKEALAEFKKSNVSKKIIYIYKIPKASFVYKNGGYYLLKSAKPSGHLTTILK